MENSFTGKSKNLSNQDLIERIENPDSFVPEAVVAAYEEIKNRELQDIDYSTVESFLSRLEEKKTKRGRA
jgi:hypothetical protein